MIKKNSLKLIISFLVAILLFSSLFFTAYASETETTVSEEEILNEENESESEDETYDSSNSVLEEADNLSEDVYEELVNSQETKKDKNAIYVTVPYIENEGTVFEPEFPYSDDYFIESSDEYNHYLMQASLGLITASFRHKASQNLPNQSEEYFEKIGFENPSLAGYDKDPTTDSIATVIASKKIDDFTLIAACACGKGYSKEWCSNLKVGDETRHVGFNEAAQKFEKRIYDYIEENNITGKIKLWFGGYSRAAAVANLVSADMIDSGDFDDVYAYLVATPNTTKDPKDYQGIYNIVGQYDPVSLIPLSTWGYGKNGKVFYLSAEETNSDWALKASDCSLYALENFKMYFRNNPDMDNQLNMVLNALGQLLPTSKDYVENLQPYLMEGVSDASKINVQEILVSALSSMDNLDPEKQQIREALVNYIEVIMTNHLKGNIRQVESFGWDNEISLANNIFHEHMPSTYYSWILSYDSTDLFADSSRARKIIISGESLDVSIFNGDNLIENIDEKGNISYNASNVANIEDYKEVFMTRNDKQTMLLIPADDNYKVTITTDKDQLITYVTSVYNTLDLSNTDIFVDNLKINSGTYVLNLDTSDYPASLEVENGEITGESANTVEYSANLMMQFEVENVFHLTISGMLMLVIGFAIFLAALLLFCLIVFIVHSIRRRVAHKVYSNMWVLIPHILISIAFAALTMFVSHNLTVITILKVLFVSLTGASLVATAVRGTLRNKTKLNLATTCVVTGLSVLAVILYSLGTVDKYNNLHTTINVIGFAILIFLSSSTFFYKSKKRMAFELSEEELFEERIIKKAEKEEQKKKKQLEGIEDKSSEKAHALELELEVLEDVIEDENEKLSDIEKEQDEFEEEYGQSVEEVLGKKDDENEKA